MADTTPTEAGFVTFCRDVAGLTTAVIPDGDAGFDNAYQFALAWVPCFQWISPVLYTSAIYNLGVSNLLNFQQDQPGQVFFTNARTSYGINNFVAGVISSASDETTSDTLTVSPALASLSLQDLQWLKDPFGRRAASILMALGPSVWGLS